jgi:hypothetical protein
MISLSSAAFGVIAALAWNSAIQDLIKLAERTGSKSVI